MGNKNNVFQWYKVKNKDEFDVLNRACLNCLNEPRNYPEIICVETVGYDPYMDDAYNYHMSDMMEDTKDFWNNLGYKVTFEKVREI